MLFEIKVVRDGTAYNLDGTEWSMDEVFPGTVWQVRIEVADRGESMKLYIDGELVAQGVEKPEEPRRTVTVARNDAEASPTCVSSTRSTLKPRLI